MLVSPGPTRACLANTSPVTGSTTMSILTVVVTVTVCPISRHGTE
jgi:hypothetical protein